jgi:hypothetical protein
MHRGDPTHWDQVEKQVEKTPNPAFSQEQKDHFRTDKEAFLKYRKSLEHEFNRFFGCVQLPPLTFSNPPASLFMKNSELQEQSRSSSVQNMVDSLKDKPELAEYLIVR